MIKDIVWIGTLLTTITSAVGFFVFLYSVLARKNGTYMDAYICALMLSFCSNYGYLWYARETMYTDYERFRFILERKDYFPLVYFVLVVLILMISHKIADIINSSKGD